MKLNKKPKFKIDIHNANKALFIVAMVLFSTPVLGELIYDFIILKKIYIVDVYRLAIFGFYISSVVFFIVIERYKNMFHEVMHIADQQEEQLHIMKNLLEAKNSGSLVDLLEGLDKRKKPKKDDDEGDLKN